jgi:hypothetical protein
MNGWQLTRGAAEFRCGRPFPPAAWDEDGKALTDDPVVIYRWYGYLLARAKYMMKCAAVENTLHNPDPHDPRPPMELAA